MIEPEKKPVEKPVDPKKQKAPVKPHTSSSPTFTEATDGIGWYLVVDGLADLVGSLLD